MPSSPDYSIVRMFIVHPAFTLSIEHF